MRRIRDQESERREIAFKVLAWVSYVFRSLSLKELQHAVAVNPGDTDLDDDLIIDGSNLTALCAGLVIVDPRTNIVNLVHYTTRDYFEKARSAYFPNFHATITMSCATYLTFDMLKSADIWQIYRECPLAVYAAQYMANHARQNPEEALESSVLDILCQLLSHPDKRKPLLALLDSLDIIKHGMLYPNQTSSLLDIYNATEPTTQGQLESLFGSMTDLTEGLSLSSTEGDEEVEEDRRSLETQVEASRIPEVTALHLAASMGLAKVAALLLKETPNIDAVDETGTTALAVAMERGFEKAVEILVNSGACVDLRHHHGRQMFLLITERNWRPVANVIAEKGRTTALEEISPTARDGVLLILAAYLGDNEDALLLLNRNNLDLSREDLGVGTCALFIATERGHLEIVKVLLDAGVDLDSKDSTGQTALYRATRRGDDILMRFLIQRGAALETKDDNGRTVFSANAKYCDDSHLRILLDAGADPNTTGHDGISELYDAAAAGDVAYVRTLLRNGTNPSITTKYGWTPLHWAANNGHLEVVKLLLSKGADHSALSDQKSTPLDMAVRANQSVVAALLIRTGAKESRDLLVHSEPPVNSGALGDSTRREDLVDVFNVPTTVPLYRTDPPDKLTLTFDKPLGERLVYGQFVYPSNFSGTNEYYYHISHPLDTPINTISIRRTTRRADNADYPVGVEKFFRNNVLYEIVSLAMDYQELELRALSEKASQQDANMTRGWNGNWKVCHESDSGSDILFRVTPDWTPNQGQGNRWITDDGKLLAKSGLLLEAPSLTLEQGLDRSLQDLLVACWIAKLWSEHASRRKLEV